MTGPLGRRAAAEYLGVSVSTLWRASKRRQIAYLDYRPGGVRYEIAALDDFKRRCTYEIRVLSSKVPRLSRREVASMEEARLQRAVREVAGGRLK
jgi:hypothetical protein